MARQAVGPNRSNVDGITTRNPSTPNCETKDSTQTVRSLPDSPFAQSITCGIFYNSSNVIERTHRRQMKPNASHLVTRIKFHAALTSVIVVASLVMSDAFNSCATKPKSHVRSVPATLKRGPIPSASQRHPRKETLWKSMPDQDCCTESEPNSTLSQMQRLQLALSGFFYHHSTNEEHSVLPEKSPYFTLSEIDDVMDSTRVAAQGRLDLMNGCAGFLYLMLTLEEEGLSTNNILVRESSAWENDAEEQRNIRPNPDLITTRESIMTRDVLVAAAFHYCDCVRAREAGVYDFARQAMVAKATQFNAGQAMKASLDVQNDQEKNKSVALLALKQQHGQETTVSVEDGRDNDKTMMTCEDDKLTTVRTMSRITDYGEEPAKIANSAARLKRGEIMSTVSGQTFRGRKKHPNDDAEILRSFLVSLSGDWRALVIRITASLYRLRQIRDYSNTHESCSSMALSTTTTSTLRDAFHVYSPLAGKLGMQRLKTELENTAFQLLYPR